MRWQLSGPAQRLAVASAVAAGVTLMTAWLFESNDGREAAPVKTVMVLVAKSYIPTQAVVDASCCYEKKIPEAYAPPHALAKKDLTSTTAATRFRARGEILKGEMLTASRVMDAANAGVGWILGDNETALTLHLTPEGAMLGVLSVGDTVNVIATSEKRACVLVPGARVMALGKSDETLVSLQLSPKDALRATLAAQKAALSIQLVSPIDSRPAPACVAPGDL